MNTTRQMATIAFLFIMLCLSWAVASAEQPEQVAMNGVTVKRLPSPGVVITSVSLSSQDDQTVLNIRLKPTHHRLPGGSLHLVILDSNGGRIFADRYDVPRHPSLRGKRAKDSRLTVRLPFAVQSDQTLILSYGHPMPAASPDDDPEESPSPSTEENKVFEIQPEKGGAIVSNGTGQRVG